MSLLVAGVEFRFQTLIVARHFIQIFGTQRRARTNVKLRAGIIRLSGLKPPRNSGKTRGGKI